MAFDLNLFWLDPALRGSVVAMLLLLAAVLWRDHGRSQSARLGAAFAIGAAASVLCSSASPGVHSAWWFIVMLIVASGNPVILCLLACSLFDDDFRLRRRQVGWWLGLAVLGVLNCRLQPGKDNLAFASDMALALAIAACALLALRQTLLTWRDDLVERRRSLRVLIVAAVGGYTLLNSTLRFVLRDSDLQIWLGVLDAAGQAAVTALVSWQLLGVSAAGLFQPAELGVLPSALPLNADKLTVVESAKADAVVDIVLVRALQTLMQQEQVYRQENMSIGSLAHLLGQPEYKLRRCINQGLGYRNFNAFLNRYRIDAVKQALADTAQADVAILDIALAAGFQSLGPFNRAFKADTGMTPSEFRREASASRMDMGAPDWPIRQKDRAG
jgi:AraC-like DNA-binding protein